MKKFYSISVGEVIFFQKKKKTIYWSQIKERQYTQLCKEAQLLNVNKAIF